jgi:hypothetical protein
MHLSYINNMFEEIITPLDQFQIVDLVQFNLLNYVNISITNIGFYLTLGSIFIIISSLLSTNYNKLVSNN